MTQSGVDRNVHSSKLPARVVQSAALVVALSLALLSEGCYGFNSGGGFPPKLRTVAILPFDNLTPVPDVQLELNDYLRKSFQDRLNLRDATEAKADVVMRGTIDKYEVDLPAGISADPRQVNVSRRRLQLVLDVEVTDQTTGRTLLKRAGMQSEGQYAEGREPDGRRLAIQTIVNDMIQQMQSQW